MRIAITGGIGSGKSYICKCIENRGFKVYDCDNAAKRLMNSSEHIRSRLIELIGNNIFEGNQLNKETMRAFLTASESNAQLVDRIVHPAVAEDFFKSGCEWMECAILFESGFNQFIDRIITVTAPEEMRITRVMNRDGLKRGTVLGMMKRQMPQEELKRRCDFEIINDGRDISPQIDKILQSLSLHSPSNK
jgi:dephospho-CoA kinase